MNECSPKGLADNIRLELSKTNHEPDEQVGNASVVSLADAGIPPRNFDAASPQAGLTAFDREVPFELVTSDLQDEGSLVTLPGEDGTNGSVVASA